MRLDEITQRNLMGRIDVGVQQADPDGFVATLLQRRDECLDDLLLIQRLQDGSVREDAFADLEAVGPAHHRVRLLVLQVINPRAVVAL